MGFSRQDTGEDTGSHSLLQGIFLTQGLNPCLPHYRQILYHLSHQGSLLQAYPLLKSQKIIRCKLERRCRTYFEIHIDFYISGGYQMYFHNPDNHDGVITHREPDILECEVKWASESITTNKDSGGYGISVELC